MDYLAIVLAGVSQRVDAVDVHRIQDAGTRRLPLSARSARTCQQRHFRRRSKRGVWAMSGSPSPYMRSQRPSDGDWIG